MERTTDYIEVLQAQVTTLREALAEFSTNLVKGENPLQVAAAMQEVLGADGEAHLDSLRRHEALVMGLMAFRANALQHLLPDTCPYCYQEGRTHTQGCFYGQALALVPENMPDVEASAVWKLGALRGRIRSWKGKVHLPVTLLQEMDEVLDDPGLI